MPSMGTLIVPVGTIIAALIAYFAATTAARIAHSTKISEFRQAWINDLRNDVATYIGLAEQVLNLCYETRYQFDYGASTVAPDRITKVNEALVVLLRIKLRFSAYDVSKNALPQKADEITFDSNFLESLEALRDLSKLGRENPKEEWIKKAECSINKARHILKREWDVTKEYTPTKLASWLDACSVKFVKCINSVKRTIWRNNTCL